MVAFSIYGQSSLLRQWWQAWSHYCNYMFDIEDVANHMFNAILFCLSIVVIIVFLYKIIKMEPQDETSMFEAYRDKVLASEEMAETIVNAVNVIVDFKKNSISAAGYERIQRDRKSADALLKHLDQLAAEEDLLLVKSQQTPLSDTTNSGEEDCSSASVSKNFANITTENKLSQILSEKRDEITDTKIPKVSKQITKAKGSRLSNSRRLPLYKGNNKGQSVTFVLPA